MKKNILLLTLCCLFSYPILTAQQVEKCAAEAVRKHRHALDETARVDGLWAELLAEKWRRDHPQGAEKTNTVYTIPVVVHVVYTNSTEQISAAQVYSQLDVLNDDFRRMNADSGSTRTEFKGVASDSEIEFCLAGKDPNGQPTSGINYVQGDPGWFGFYDPFTENVKSSSSGGADPWPSSDYLNIWVCNLFPGILGYAQFPGEDPATDGVVIHYTAFGTMGTVTAPSTGGRTAVHEVGHWLGLRHIWGDGDCTADDFVGDTPSAGSQSSGCDFTKNSCTDPGTDLPDMVENYMDYSDDICMNLFTQGQKQRMHSFLLTDRASLLDSDGCDLTPVSLTPQSIPDAVAVYPNPSHGAFHLETGNHKIQQIEVLDLLGKTVPADIAPDFSGIDLDGQAPGIYLLRIHAQEKIFTQKIELFK